MRDEDKTKEQLIAERDAFRSELIGLREVDLERRNAEDAQRAGEERLRQVVQNMPVLLIALDNDRRILVWNAECERVTGYPAGEMIRVREALNRLYPDDADRAEIIAQWEEGGAGYSDHDVELTARDGSRRNVAWSTMAERFPIPGWRTWVVGVDLTEQKAIEKRRRLLAQLLDSVRESVVAADLDGRIIYWGRGAETLFQYSAREVLGREASSILDPGPGDGEEDPIEQVKNTGSWSGKSAQVRKDGSRFIADTVISLVRDEKGRPAGFVGLDRDITERRQAEENLRRKTEELGERVRELNCLFEISNHIERDDLHLDELAQGVIDRLPPAWQKPEGTSVALTVGGVTWNSAPFVEEGERLTVKINVGDAIAGELTVFRTPPEDGGLASAYTENQARLIETVADTLGRLFKRKRDEERLRHSEESNRTILDAIPDAMALVDRSGRVVNANRTMAERFQRRLTDVIGRNILTELSPPEVGGARLQAFQQVLRSRRPIRYIDQRGNMILENMAYPILDASGEVRVVAVYSRDITEPRRARQKLLDYQNQLRELATELSVTEERERRQIAVDLHDSVGQLMALAQIKLTRMIKTGAFTGSAEEAEDLLDMIQSAAMDARDLSRALHPASLHELGLAVALDELTEYLQDKHGVRSRFIEKGGTLNLGPDIRVIVFRITRELAMNVVKHARASSMTVTLDSSENRVRVIVADDGQGFVVDSVLGEGRKKGFGLISIRERLTHLGGSMSIEAAPGRGTRVTLELPAAAGSETNRGAPDNGPDVPPPASGGPRPKLDA